MACSKGAENHRTACKKLAESGVQLRLTLSAEIGIIAEVKTLELSLQSICRTQQLECACMTTVCLTSDQYLNTYHLSTQSAACRTCICRSSAKLTARNAPAGKEQPARRRFCRQTELFWPMMPWHRLARHSVVTCMQYSRQWTRVYTACQLHVAMHGSNTCSAAKVHACRALPGSQKGQGIL